MHLEVPLSVTDLEGLSKCAQLHKLLDFNFDIDPRASIKQAKRVIKKKGDVNYQIPTNSLLWPEDKFKGATLLHIACTGYTHTIVEELLKLDADFTVKHKDGLTALHCAFNNSTHHNKFSKYQDDLSINLILSAHVKLANSSNPCDKNRFSHFHIACAANHVKAIQLFLESGIDVNQVISKDSKYNTGFTPLHIAIQCCSVDTVELLLKHDVDKNIQNNDGMTPLVQLINQKIQLLGCFRFNKVETRSILEDKLEKIDKMIAMFVGDLNKIDTVDSIGLTSFHIACTMKDSSTVESLLEQVQDLDHCINTDSPVWPGYTAMHFAAHCNVKILNLLHSRGANVNVKNAKGLTPFDICIDVGYVEDVQEVILLKPELSSILFSDNKTSLINFLSALQSTDKLKNFLHCLDDINMTLPENSPIWPGYTLLHLAVILSRNYEEQDKDRCSKNGSIFDQIEELLKNGADVTIKNSTGRSPLHDAFRENKNVVSQLLRKYHSSSGNSVDEYNLSHLHIACFEDDQTLIDKLLSNNEIDVNIMYTGEKDVNGIKPGSTPLDLTRKFSEIKFLLKRRGAKYSPSIHDSNPLHIACNKSDEDAVKQLLKLGADVNFTFDDGQTPLHVAVNQKSTEIVQILLQRGADLLAKDNEGNTPLFFVFKECSKYNKPAAYAHRRLVFSFLKQNKELQKRVEKKTGVTMLHIACFMLDADEVKRQLDNGVDVNTQVKQESKLWPECTPLHVLFTDAEEDVQKEVDIIMDLLLKQGANVTIGNVRKETPIHISYDGGEGLRTKLLLKHQRDYTVNPIDIEGFTHFYLAVLANDVDAIKKFLEHGVDPNQPIGYFNELFGGTTPLHKAIEKSSKTIVDLLLRYGADVNLEDEFGNSPLLEAINTGTRRLELAKKLVNLGANIHCENIHGITPFERILFSSDVSIKEIRFFLRHGCRANASNPANDQGYLGLILNEVDKTERDLLFEEMMSDPNVAKVNEFGRTLIHNIVADDDPEITSEEYVDLFKRFNREFGFDVDDQDYEGKTALHLAAKFYNEKAISALFNSGADLNIVDSNGNTPLYYSTEPCVRCNEGIHRDVDHEGAIAVFVMQILKMHALDLYVSQSNIRDLVTSINLITHINVIASKDFCCQACFAKHIIIEPLLVTLGDFLSESKAVIKYSFLLESSRDLIDETFKSIDNNKFKEIMSLLKLQHRKAVSRFQLIQETSSLKLLIEFPLPDLCMEIILSFLTIADLKNVVAAINLTN